MGKMRISADEIKRLVVTALASDDFLMETLILKGGNALQIAYYLTHRASLDFDFSMDEDFQDIEEAGRRIEKALTETFAENGYRVFDYRFIPRPMTPREETQDFWGGYMVQFKFIEESQIQHLGADNEEAIRKNAIPMQYGGSTNIQIEISKYEYVGDRREVTINDFSVRVYAPRLLAFEKVRAICQQLDGYSAVVPSFSPRPRARDFYDIHTLLTHFEAEIDLHSAESRDILRKVFDAKRVPHAFLQRIGENRELHQQDFVSLSSTVTPTERAGLRDFDFYFDFVVNTFRDFLEEDQNPLG